MAYKRAGRTKQRITARLVIQYWKDDAWHKYAASTRRLALARLNGVTVKATARMFPHWYDSWEGSYHFPVQVDDCGGAGFRPEDVGIPPVGLYTHAVTTDTDDLGEAWRRTEAALPEGWTLDGLRCASTGLVPEQRSDDWVAVALGPDGEERRARASDPFAALEGLVADR